MIPIVYVSGKFRHYLPNGTFDHPKMEAEIKAEQRWVRIVARAGCAWYAPLANTHFLQGAMDDEKFIERDLVVIRRLRPGRDFLLLRPNWKTSEGARLELAQAQDCEIEVVYGIQGEEVVFEYLSAKVEGREPELEDALDVAEAEKRLAEPTVPLEQVVRELGD